MLKSLSNLNMFLFLLILLVFVHRVSFAEDFSACKLRLIQQAQDLNISQKTISKALVPIKPIKKTLSLDNNQPEFTNSYARYFHNRITIKRIAKGKHYLKKYRVLLNNLTKTYGVPGHYILAFWGLETNYGRTMGRFPILNTTVTLACDTRRSEFFTNEVMATLKLIETHELNPKQMIGSWAGAMGHTQFMPSTYLTYGKNGDKDSRIDLWNSIPDALTSAANYLSAIGWQKEWKWGREIIIPKNFNFKDLDLEQIKPLSEWKNLGITNIFGNSVANMDSPAKLLIPSGYPGPAFLVYKNYDIIMKWNRSSFYALTVGHLADRINGLPPLKNSPSLKKNRITMQHIKKLQNKLNLLGFQSGDADGYLGLKTKKAIKAFEISQGILPDGYPDKKVFHSLNISLL